METYTKELFRTSYIDLAAALKSEGIDHSNITREVFEGKKISVIEFKRTLELDQVISKFRNKALQVDLYKYMRARRIISESVKAL